MGVQMPRWSRQLWQPARYKSIRGGRSSSKTWSVSRYLVLEASQKTLSIICAREFHIELDASAQRSLQLAIDDLGLTDRWQQNQNKFTNNETGSTIDFHGLVRNPHGIRGWESVDILWLEEAQRIDEELWGIIEPTIRKEGSTIILTWNPTNRTDAAWQRFVVHAQPGDVNLLVNYNDNPFLSEEICKQIEFDRQYNPHIFAHRWLGEPDDGDADTKVLAYSLVDACVEAYRRELHAGVDLTPVHAGLDVADGGADRNALVIRRGPVIEEVYDWPTQRSGYLTPTARQAHRYCDEANAWKLFYDRSGVGSPLRGLFAEMERDYGVQGVSFGDAVGGPGRHYDRLRTNKDAFARRNAQLAFALRLRAMRTVRLLQGDDVDPNTCLFIRPSLPGIEGYTAELTRPLWRSNPTSGKIELDKRGDEDKSPDRYDATALAFAQDSESGLRAR